MYAITDIPTAADNRDLDERVRLLEERIDRLEHRFERERDRLLEEDLKARGLK